MSHTDAGQAEPSDAGRISERVQQQRPTASKSHTADAAARGRAGKTQVNVATHSAATSIFDVDLKLLLSPTLMFFLNTNFLQL